jgi:dTDP-4-amino-4,6-dideoxy-D-galactose acyltransferase
MIDYELLDWDTKFFGFKVVRLMMNRPSKEEFYNCLSKAKSENVALIYGVANPDDQQVKSLMKREGALLADEKYTFRYVCEKENSEEHIQSDFIYSAQPKDWSEELKALALQAGVYSRFKIDPKFRVEQFKALYTQWLEKSLSRTICNEVFVYRENQSNLGLVTLKLDHEQASIGLIAVAEQAARKAIGTKLLGKTKEFCAKNQVKHLFVATQKANVVACNFYQKNGFALSQSQLIYHVWL